MKCKKCNEIMLPAGREYTYEVYECQECGYEELVNEDGEVAIDYQLAWLKLREWVENLIENDVSCAYSIKEKMAEILKEQT